MATKVSRPVSTQRITPFGKFVLVRPIVKTMTEGGIALPETSKTGQHIGLVLAIGTGVKDHDVREGVTVLYKRYSANPVEGTAEVLVEIDGLMSRVEA